MEKGHRLVLYGQDVKGQYRMIRCRWQPQVAIPGGKRIRIAFYTPNPIDQNSCSIACWEKSAKAVVGVEIKLTRSVISFWVGSIYVPFQKFNVPPPLPPSTPSWLGLKVMFYHYLGGSWLSYQDPLHSERGQNAFSLWNNNLGYQSILEYLAHTHSPITGHTNMTSMEKREGYIEFLERCWLSEILSALFCASDCTLEHEFLIINKNNLVDQPDH
jgi:hypothetical protein